MFRDFRRASHYPIHLNDFSGFEDSPSMALPQSGGDKPHLTKGFHDTIINSSLS